MIRIPPDIGERIDFVVGESDAIANRPREIFCAQYVAFLGELSRAILGDPSVRSMPDVAAFGFWCRAANLKRQAERHVDPRLPRVGLGLSFHICPANVPVNFAYSLAFGLLSGNSCVVRLPSRPSATADYLVSAIAGLLGQRRWRDLRDAIALIRYARDDAVNAFWSAVADGRIVWGGDSTIDSIRHHRLPPRGREIAFSDRYSLCLLDAAAVAQASEAGIGQLCEALFNDVYLNDQAACSSPQLIAWIGEEATAAAAKARLWPAMLALAQQRYAPEPVQMMDKFTHLCEHLIDAPNIAAVDAGSSLLYRIELDGLSPSQAKARAYFGTVQEVVLDTPERLAAIVDPSVQTITYYGCDASALAELVVARRLRGVDRIVPVGRALDIGLIWDGYDIIGSMSRVIVWE